MSRQLHTDLPSAGEDTHHLMVAVAHSVERSVVVREVAGSNPVSHPNFGLLFT
jgi:hypothetical protein